MTKPTRTTAALSSTSAQPESDEQSERSVKSATARAARVKPAAATESQKFVVEVARLLSDYKCTDVMVMDIRGLSTVTDFVVVGSGSSDRQMRSVLEHVEQLGGKMGFKAFRTNSDDRASWLLVDFVDAIVHLFEPNTRAHYDLEMLWGDAPRIEWERPEQLPRNRAGLQSDDGTFGTHS